MKIGDTVEYVTERGPTGVVGVVTGFFGERARVLCPSGHEWILRPGVLKLIEKTVPSTPDRAGLSR